MSSTHAIALVVILLIVARVVIELVVNHWPVRRKDGQ